MLKLGKHLIIMIVLAVGLVLLTFFLLGVYTGDNESNVIVPNIENVRIDKAKDSLEKYGLRYEIIDSVFSEEHRRMSVTSQDPSAGSEVKPNRKIYIIINSLSKPMVNVPKLKNKSFSFAKTLLNKSGLKLGKVTEVYSNLGSGFVIQQFYKGDSMSATGKIEKGSTIDLWVSKAEQEYEEVEGEATEEQGESTK